MKYIITELSPMEALEVNANYEIRIKDALGESTYVAYAQTISRVLQLIFEDREDVTIRRKGRKIIVEGDI